MKQFLEPVTQDVVPNLAESPLCMMTKYLRELHTATQQSQAITANKTNSIPPKCGQKISCAAQLTKGTALCSARRCTSIWGTTLVAWGTSTREKLLRKKYMGVCSRLSSLVRRTMRKLPACRQICDQEQDKEKPECPTHWTGWGNRFPKTYLIFHSH